MRAALLAALPYFAAVFAVGFLMGTVRVLLLAPRIGDLGAVLAELPVMLAVSWVAACWAVGRFAVPPRLAPRLAMGAFAFALLMAAETLLGVVGFGRSFAEVLAGYAAAEGLVGLAGQALFGLMPAIVALHERPVGPDR